MIGTNPAAPVPVSTSAALRGDQTANNNNTASSPSTPTKVHTCGSLFANCACAISTETIDQPSSAADSVDTVDAAANRRKTLYQSYSHPDTSFVFTDANRNPQRIARNHSTVTRTKRMSTPCAPGTYSVLSVAVHPDLMLAMSHQNGRIEPISTETVATALGRAGPGAARASVLKNKSSTATAAAAGGAVPRRMSGALTAEDAQAASDRQNAEYMRAIGQPPIAEDEATSSSDERRDSFRTMQPQQPIGGYNRRQSRSLGDPSRVEQVCVSNPSQ